MKLSIKTSVIRSLVLAGLMAGSALYADENAAPASKPRPNELSIRFSNLTGYGAAYQRNFLTDYYVRTTAWVKYYERVQGQPSAPINMKSDNTYNVGLDLQRNIIAEDNYRVFGFIGGGYAVRQKAEIADSVAKPNNLEQALATGGLGGGIEYRFLKNVSMDIGVSYKFDYLVKENVVVRNAQTGADIKAPETTKETGLGLNVGLNLSF